MAREKSILPVNLPLATTNSGLSTGLSPWTTTVKVPPNLPRPVTRLMLSDPVALMVQVVAPGLTMATSAAGQSGLATFAVPISSEVALRRGLSLPTSFMFSVSSYSVASAASAVAPNSGAATNASRASSAGIRNVRLRSRLMASSSLSSFELRCFIQSLSCRFGRKQDAYQHGEFSDVSRNRALGCVGRDARAIADRFLAGTLCSLGAKLADFRNSARCPEPRGGADLGGLILGSGLRRMNRGSATINARS